MYVITDTAVKPVYNDYSREQKFVAIVDKWLLFRALYYENWNQDPEIVVVVDKWSLLCFICYRLYWLFGWAQNSELKIGEN